MTELTEQSPTFLVAYLGGGPTLKTLQFLLENRREHWSMKEIAQQGNIAYPSLKIVLPQLLARNLIIIDKRIGKIKLYRINVTNPIVKKLAELESAVIKQEVGWAAKRPHPSQAIDAQKRALMAQHR